MSIKGQVSIQTITDELEDQYRDFHFTTEVTITIDELFICDSNAEKYSEKSQANHKLASNFESSIADIYKIINIDPKQSNSALITNNFLLIGILQEFIYGTYKDEKISNQTSLIERIVELYAKDIRSISKRTLNTKLPNAKKVYNIIKEVLETASKEHEDAIKPEK